MIKLDFRPNCLVTIICLLGVLGCQKAEEIVVHRIPKTQSELDRLRAAPEPARRSSHAQVAVPSRMVVALALREDATWFFKVSGPVDQVSLTEPVWREFFGSIKFASNGKPQWDLPTDWKVGPERSMRYATLLMTGTSPPLEMSISSLGPNQDLVSNVNRWRGQLQLDPTAKDALDLNKIPYAEGELLLFDQTGISTGGGMGGPMMRGPMQGGPPSVASEPTDSITYDNPDGWQAGPSNSIVKARLLKAADEKKAQITVVEMPASANEWGPNVIRWAGEIGMNSITVDEIADRTTEVIVGGIESMQIHLVEAEDEYDKATIAVMAKRGQSAWFFKISGDKEVVTASKSEFEQFLSSIKFN